MHIHWIWLATRPELSDRQRLAVLEAMEDPEAVYMASEQALSQIPDLPEKAREALLDKDLKPAQKILRQCTDKDISLLTYRDPRYPVRLKHIADPPLVLYYKGTLPQWEQKPVITVVGTRKASAYGCTAALQMGYQLVRCGATVVSGAADGIDAAAMEGALKAGGQVVAVLGCGADVVYPAKNKKLFLETQRHGCLLTEFPPGTRPLKWNFPKRNRILSGLSNGVVVVEAPERSGALITARLALDQGRDVFAVPGNIGVASSEGTNDLLRQGAILVRSGWDVVSEYEGQYPDAVSAGGARERMPGVVALHREEPMAKVAQISEKPEKESPLDKSTKKKPIDKTEMPSYSVRRETLASLTERERSLVEKLQGEMLVDDLIAASALPAGQVLAMLTMLEIRGIVARLPGKRVRLCYEME